MKITIILLIFFLYTFNAIAENAKNKIEIICTLFATYDFAKQIGKDKVNVSLLIPPGVEAHSYELKPFDIIKINKADIFIYTGKYMEPFIENLLKSISNPNLIIIDASTNIFLIENYKEHECHQHHHQKDPHIWLDLKNCQTIVSTITSTLIKKNTYNKKFYLKNKKEYNKKLAILDNKFKKMFSKCEYKTIIFAGHFAFGYFVKHYGLNYISLYKGFSPNAEPKAKAIAEIIDKVKSLKIKYIFYEELVNPKIAKIISKETAAKLELLHAAHNVSKDEFKRNISYLEIMEENFKKLKIGLKSK